MSKTNKIPQRCEIPVEDTWAVEDLFPSDEAWEEALAKMASVKEELAAYAEEMGAPALPGSGRQEYLEAVVNSILFNV